MSTRLVKDVLLTAIAGRPKDVAPTLAAVEHCLKLVPFESAQVLTCVEFTHPVIKCVPIPPMTYDDFNIFMQEQYVQHITKPHFLHVQDDGFIINPGAWTDELLSYDYVGALWPVGAHNPVVTPKDRCGNGGFSLRSKRLMQHVARYTQSRYGEPEDTAICRRLRGFLERSGMRWTPDHLAARFSIEDTTIPEAAGANHSDRKTFQSFGFHMAGSDCINYLKEA